MGSNRPGAGDDASDEELRTLLMFAGSRLVRNGDAAAFLDWMAESGPMLAPSIAGRVDPATGPVGLAFRSMGRMIYDATPLPENGWAPRALPVPGRNEPCHCGSGLKYKHCCEPLARLPKSSGSINMLPWVLAAVPLKRFAELPGSRVSAEAVALTAAEWQDEGDEKRAVALLEPWFAGTGPLDRRRVPMFDLLATLYDRLDQPRKKLNLIAKAIARGDATMQAEGWMRRCAILADRRDHAGARAAFTAAQRLDPDNPNLALLEVTVLIGRGDQDEARARAAFWLQRLRRTHPGDAGIDQIVDVLRRTVENPGRVLGDIARESDPAFDRLIALLQGAPAPENLYRLVPQAGGSAGPLAPVPELKRAEALWHKRFAAAKPVSVDLSSGPTTAWKQAAAWLELIEASPMLWQSFDVLDDLVLASDGLHWHGVEEALLSPLLDRAVRLFARVRAANRVEGLRMEWSWCENRPALRLLARAAVVAVQSSDTKRAVELMEPLVLELNPEDNHGFRYDLSRCYLELRRPQDVLRLARLYPDDPCDLAFDRALALYMLGNAIEAVKAMQQAHRRSPRVLPMLCRSTVKAPANLHPDRVTVGGTDEAWFYRESRRALWLREDALKVAQAAARAVDR
jgi:tetratricopeptide (TPR) repeat protein